jgi:hypothetical protein
MAAAAAAMSVICQPGMPPVRMGVHHGLRIPSFHQATERVVHTRVLGPRVGRRCRGPGVFLAAVPRWHLVLATALRGAL